MAPDEGEFCFVIEDGEGRSYELEVRSSDDRARDHFQSVWQRLAMGTEWFYNKECPPSPEWVQWKPWKWCDDKRADYAPRQKFVGWCGPHLAGLLNVWPGFPSPHQAGQSSL